MDSKYIACPVGLAGGRSGPAASISNYFIGYRGYGNISLVR